MDDDEASMFACMMNCKRGELPFMYMGLPLHYKKLPKHCWLLLIEKMSARLASWKGKLLYLGGRLTLINALLSALHFYFMSMLRIPRWVIKRIDTL